MSCFRKPPGRRGRIDAPLSLLREQDRAAVALRLLLDRIVVPLAYAAEGVVRTRASRQLGYARLEDHARERFSRSGRWLRDLAKLGTRLSELPPLARALDGRDGERPIGRVAAAALADVATPRTADVWVGLARELSCRELQRAIGFARACGRGRRASGHDSAGISSIDDPGGMERDAPDAGFAGSSPEGRVTDDSIPAAGSPTSTFSTDSVVDRAPTVALPGSTSSLRGTAGGPADGEATGPALIFLPAGSAPSRRVNGEWSGRAADAERSTFSTLADDLSGGEGRSGNGEGCTRLPGDAVAVGSIDPDLCAAPDGQSPECPDRIVRVAVPQPVKAMFDETVDLYRHLEGFEGGAVSLVEALVAEAYAGPAPPEDDLQVPGSRPRRPEAEPNPSGLPEPAADGAFRLAAESLARFERVAARAGTGGPVDLDAQVRTFLRIEDQLHARLGRLLLAMDRCHAWLPLGFQGLGQYAEERLGIPRRTLQSRARLARQLESRPLLRQAYETGEVGFEKTRAAVRALGTQPCESGVERAWVTHARQVTVKRLRDEAREIDRKALGLPWRKAVPPLDDATWQKSLRCEAGGYRRRVRELGRMALQDPRVDVFLRLRLPEESARSFLGSVEARRRLLAEQAAELHRIRSASGPLSGSTFSTLEANAGDETVLDDAPGTAHGTRGSTFSTLEANAGDETVLDDAPPAAGTPTRSATGGANASGETGEAGSDADGLPGVPIALLLAHSFVRSGAPVPAWVGLVGMLEDFADTWDVEPMRRKFAAVYGRDDMRCTAAGCTSRRHLEDHHIVFRSQGGGDQPENQTTGCRFHHHLGAHGRFGACAGSAPLDVRWRLGRREFGAWFRNERLLEDPTLEYTGEISWWYWRKKEARASGEIAAPGHASRHAGSLAR